MPCKKRKTKKNISILNVSSIPKMQIWAETYCVGEGVGEGAATTAFASCVTLSWVSQVVPINPGEQMHLSKVLLQNPHQHAKGCSLWQMAETSGQSRVFSIVEEYFEVPLSATAQVMSTIDTSAHVYMCVLCFFFFEKKRKEKSLHRLSNYNYCMSCLRMLH